MELGRVFHELTVRSCGVLRPQPAHGVVHAREDSHWKFAWIFADKLAVDLEDGPQFCFEVIAGLVRQVQVDLVLATDAHAFVDTHAEDFP